MKINVFLFIFFFTVSIGSDLSGVSSHNAESVSSGIYVQDTLKEDQILYNGRLWRNRYYKIREDQFLFSGEFLRGSVTIEGRSYKNIILRYDIYNDEIMTPTNKGAILQLNKEMVDSFNIIFHNKVYYFTNIQDDNIKGFKGYVNVLNNGKTALYVKYKKEIEPIAIEKKYDVFYQVHRIYFLKDGVVHLITSKSEFLNLLDEYKIQIRSFIKKNRIKISKKIPDSFLPVIEFYNSLRK